MFDNRTSLIIMNGLPGLGASKIHRLCSDFPDFGLIFELTESRLQRLGYLSCRSIENILHWQTYIDIDTELSQIESSGITLITCNDASYPLLLHQIHDYPVCLYVRGDYSLLSNCDRNIAIVGSRNTTNYGLRCAAQLSSGAVLAGWTVISGLARGIDTQTHTAVLRNHGRTIAVLGSGLFEIYPPENQNLAKDICAYGGAIISEYPLHFKPDRYSFPVRNRIISGLCRGTIVVEAGLQSGSLITATHAIEQGRSVFAVPGCIDTPYSRGCHSLLRDGAILTESFQDILDEFSLLPFARSQSAAKHQAPPPVPEITLTSNEMQIWNQLGTEPVQIDTLLDNLDMPVSLVLSTILLMEIKHAILQHPGKYFTRNANIRILSAASQ